MNKEEKELQKEIEELKRGNKMLEEKCQDFEHACQELLFRIKQLQEEEGVDNIISNYLIKF